MFEVEEMCDSVVIMSYGHVVESGAPAELIERYECESLDEVFMAIAEEEGEEGEEGEDDEEEWYEDEEEGEFAKPVSPAKAARG